MRSVTSSESDCPLVETSEAMSSQGIMPVQRALADMEAAGQVRAIGRARARRWVAQPLVGFTTILLLPASPSSA